MIITQPAVLRKRDTAGQKQTVEVADMAGIDVVVLVESIYNGPNHKSLGMCKVGAAITVAAGPYAQSLLASKLVALPSDVVIESPSLPPTENEMLPTDSPPSEPAVEEPVLDESWQVLLEAGVSERQAKIVAAAGYTTKESIATAIRSGGTAPLTDLAGIGINTALKLAAWAGVDMSGT